MMWHNVRAAALNATLQLLVILVHDPRNARATFIYHSLKNM